MWRVLAVVALLMLPGLSLASDLPFMEVPPTPKKGIEVTVRRDFGWVPVRENEEVGLDGVIEYQVGQHEIRSRTIDVSLKGRNLLAGKSSVGICGPRFSIRNATAFTEALDYMTQAVTKLEPTLRDMTTMRFVGKSEGLSDLHAQVSWAGGGLRVSLSCKSLFSSVEIELTPKSLAAFRSKIHEAKAYLESQ